MKKFRRSLWLGLVLSGALVALLLVRTDFAKLAEAFRRANYLFCIPMIAVVLLGMFVRAYRWRFIMAPLHRAAMRNLFSATMIGFMANYVLPARMGELIRAYLIGQTETISKISAFGTIVVERLFDTLTVLIILVGVLFMISRPDSPLDAVYATSLKAAGLLLCFAFVGVLGFLTLLKMKTAQTLDAVRWCLQVFSQTWREKILGLLEAFVSGLGAVRPGAHLVQILFYSALMWGLYALGNDFMLQAFRIDLPGYVPYYLLVVQAVAVAIPASPGFVGTYHAAVVAGLAAFEIPEETGLSFAILSHFLLIVPIILSGLFLLWREHLSLNRLEVEAEGVAEETRFP